MFLYGLLLGKAIRDGLPASVDLRPGFARAGLAVCRQNGPLCWAYTVTGVAEFEMATHRRTTTRLSVGYLEWAARQTDAEGQAGSNFDRAYRAFARYGVTPLALGGDPDARGNGTAPTEAALDAAKGQGRVGVNWIRFWDDKRRLSDEELRTIKAEIAGGHPVAVGMRWPKTTAFEPGTWVMKTPGLADVFDGHCVALVGYRDVGGGGAFLFRNSWGDDWADGGYAWMPYELLSRCINDAVSLRVAPPLAPASGPSVPLDATDLRPSADGTTTVQRMTSFGKGWSRDDQVLLLARRPGERLTLRATVPKAGRYELRLRITRAPDYGTFETRIDDTAPADGTIRIDGVGPGVSRSESIPAGIFDLAAGEHRVTLTVTGRSIASQGFLFGVDTLEFVPVPEGRSLNARRL